LIIYVGLTGGRNIFYGIKIQGVVRVTVDRPNNSSYDPYVTCGKAIGDELSREGYSGPVKIDNFINGKRISLEGVTEDIRVLKDSDLQVLVSNAKMSIGRAVIRTTQKGIKISDLEKL